MAEARAMVKPIHFRWCFDGNSHIRSLAERFLADFPMKLAGGARPGEV
jgi:hypothetical protein